MKIIRAKSLKLLVVTICLSISLIFNFNGAEIKSASCFDSQLSVLSNEVLEGYEIQFDLDYQSNEPICSPADIVDQKIILDFSDLVASGSDISYSIDSDIFDINISPEGVVTLTFKDLSASHATLVDFGGNAVFSMVAKQVDGDQDIVVTNSNGDNLGIKIIDIARAAENTNKGSFSNYVEVGDTVTYQILINNHENSITDFQGLDSHSPGFDYLDGTFRAQQDEVWKDMSDYFVASYDVDGNMVIENTKPFDVPVLLTYEMVVTDPVVVYHNQFEASYDLSSPEIVGDDVWYNLDSDGFIDYTHGNIQISKYDQQNNPIPGAEFDIIDNSGKVVEHLTTNNHGTVESSNLQLGTYTVVETTAADGYEMDSNSYKVVLTEDNLTGKIRSVGMPIDDSQNHLQIRLMNEMGEGLSNVSFGIYDPAGNLIDTITTDENGNATSKYLKPGKYYLQQLNTLNGYLLNSTKYWFEIGGGDTNIEYQITNQKITGSLQVEAIDEQQNPIVGTKFTVYKSNGNLVNEVSVDQNGLGLLDNLDYGSYYLIQSAVPDGYVKDTSTYYFDIENQDDLATITIENKTAGSSGIETSNNPAVQTITTGYSLANTGKSTTLLNIGLGIALISFLRLKHYVMEL